MDGTAWDHPGVSMRSSTRTLERSTWRHPGSLLLAMVSGLIWDWSNPVSASMSVAAGMEVISTSRTVRWVAHHLVTATQNPYIGFSSNKGNEHLSHCWQQRNDLLGRSSPVCSLQRSWVSGMVRCDLLSHDGWADWSGRTGSTAHWLGTGSHCRSGLLLIVSIL